MLQQIICTIKIRRAPTRHDNIDFRPFITRTSNILPLSVVTADKGYDSEDKSSFGKRGLTCVQCDSSDMNMCQYGEHMINIGNR